MKKSIATAEIAEDITKQKLTVQALQDTVNKHRKSEELLQSIFDHSEQLLAHLDRDFNFIKVNRAYAEADKHEPSFFVGKNHFDLFPNAENEAIFSRVAATGVPHRETAKPFEYEKNPERGISHWDWTLIPLKDTDGQVSALFLMLLNVSERVNAIEELKRSEERYELAVKGSNAGLWDWNIETDEGYFSPRWKEILGYDEDELEPRVDTFFEFLHPDDSDRTRRANAAHLKDRIPYDLEYRLRHKDGGYVWVHAAGQAVWDETGEPVRMAGSITDISDRKRAERALTGSETRYRQLAELSPDGMFVHVAGEIVFANASLAKILAAPSPSDLLGKQAFELIAPEYHAAALQRRKRLMRGEVLELEVSEVVRFDGSRVPIERTGTMVSWDNTPAVLVLVRDISERNEAEKKAQEQAEELAHIQRLNAVGQLSSALAHELNQPLAATMSYLQAGRRLLKNEDEERAAKVPDLLDKAADQVDRAGAVVHRLRGFIDNRRSAHTEESINEAVEGACSIALIGARDGDVDVTLDLDDQVLPVLIDRIQIEQVVLNLVRNAIEAMEGRQKRELTIKTSRRDGGIVVAVTDTGPGLADEMFARLFEPFVTTKEAGMGVGLSISRSIIEAHGGQIWATKNPAGGTTFKFSLPAAQHSEAVCDERANYIRHR